MVDGNWYLLEHVLFGPEILSLAVKWCYLKKCVSWRLHKSGSGG